MDLWLSHLQFAWNSLFFSNLEQVCGLRVLSTFCTYILQIIATNISFCSMVIYRAQKNSHRLIVVLFSYIVYSDEPHCLVSSEKYSLHPNFKFFIHNTIVKKYICLDVTNVSAAITIRIGWQYVLLIIIDARGRSA